MRRIAAVLTAAVAMACGGSSSSPSPAATTTPAPVVRANLTGTWDFSLVGTPSGSLIPVITLSLSEIDGAVSGVLQFSGDTEAPGLKGTISPARELVLTGEWVALSAAVDATGRSFSGSYVVKEDDGSTAAFSVRGTKRTDAPATLVPNNTRVPGRSRADDVPFTLPAGTRNAIITGPVLAAASRTDITLSFDGSFIILGCYGTPSACVPFGGRPATITITIPGFVQPGILRAQVYFNPNFPQPSGDARGVVRFNYNPQWR